MSQKCQFVCCCFSVFLIEFFVFNYVKMTHISCIYVAFSSINLKESLKATSIR